MVVELANGTNGYIPPDYVMDTAAYEAKISKYNSYCGKGTAEKLIRQSIRQLYALSEC